MANAGRIAICDEEKAATPAARARTPEPTMFLDKLTMLVVTLEPPDGGGAAATSISGWLAGLFIGGVLRSSAMAIRMGKVLRSSFTCETMRAPRLISSAFIGCTSDAAVMTTSTVSAMMRHSRYVGTRRRILSRLLVCETLGDYV